MKSFSGFSLDDDIINHVLTSLPDFDSLKATILSTKSFYNVYKAHPNSIRRAVAENVVGPALPEALRVVRHHDPEESETEDEDASEGETDANAPIRNEEISELAENAKMFRALEDVFSLRHKNRKFKKSQLTYDESLRFQRAIYRLALYSKVFRGTALIDEWLQVDDDDDEDEENTALPESQAKKRKEQIAFLRHFPVLDLRQIYSVSEFLIDLVRWSEAGDSSDGSVDTHNNGKEKFGLFFAFGLIRRPLASGRTGLFLSCGPEIIYRCYNEGSIEILMAKLDWYDDVNPPALFGGYITDPLSKLFKERDFKGAFEDVTHWQSIVDDAVGIHDPCSRCGQEGGFNLWGPSTYEYLHQTTPSLRPETGLIALMKGNLPMNPVEKRYFGKLIKDIPKDENIYEHVIQDLLGSDYKTPKYEDWTPDDWLCTECLTKFLEEHLHLWLLDKKIQGKPPTASDACFLTTTWGRTAGEKIPGDCWYGWHCRTQVHKKDHARKLNSITTIIYMKNFSILLLDDDILNHILTSLPDFDSLKSMILSTKTFYDVYEAHPNSIRRAVAENVVGPALPEALRVVRHRDPCDIETEDEDEADESFITNKEIPELVENARMFRELEDVFSLRHKNREFKKSQLTYDESLRFQRAIYRFTLFSKVFDLRLLGELFDSDEDSEIFQIKREEQIEFFRPFSVPELRQIYSVSVFLTELFHWAEAGDEYELVGTDASRAGFALSSGPPTIYRCYNEGSVEELMDEVHWDQVDDPGLFFAGYLTHPLSELFKKRNFKGAFEDVAHWRSIVDDVVGIHDSCSRCNTEGGFNLWGPSTYKYLHQTVPSLRPGSVVTLLKGDLSKNLVETTYFNRFIGEIHEDTYEHIVQDILDSDYKTPEYKGCKPNGWLCTECMTKLLKEHLHLWLLDKKIEEGNEIPENCWYGWNCHTQTYSPSHAKKLNVIARSSLLASISEYDAL
ncbi:hypothetical protein PQX77_000810 [Marasmius sp. AFHP31]|nr:hypothetical protein PQX77_000810 [Marasmius sp. AFHP31]